MNGKPLGRRINAARKEKGLTSEKLSELCDINATYLRQIETGRKIPSLPMFVLLCQKLQVSPSYLLADVVDGYGNVDEIMDLYRQATPMQFRLIVAMIHSALDVISKERIDVSD